MRKDVTIVFLLVAVIILIFFSFIQKDALNRGKNDLTGSSLKAKLGPFEAEQRLDFTKNTQNLAEGFVESTSKVTSPVNASITVNTISRDNVTVSGVWQDGRKTVIVLEPTANQT